MAGKVLCEGKDTDMHSADGERIREDGRIDDLNGNLLTNAKSHTA